jgi:HSP20 family protein
MAGLAKRDRPMWPMWLTRGLPEWLRESGLPELDDWLDRDGMRLEEYREDGTLVVKAEMPGIDPDKDVTISVDHGVLTFSAERRQEKKTEDKHGYHTEFRYGSVARSVRLPAGATDSDVKATYTDGILEIRFPVDAAAAEARKIPVSRG